MHGCGPLHGAPEVTWSTFHARYHIDYAPVILQVDLDVSNCQLKLKQKRKQTGWLCRGPLPK